MERKFLIGFILVVFCVSMILGAIPISFAQEKYKEAPMFTDLVKTGKLPPVEERLPENPRVVKVRKEIGKYGGVIRYAELGWQVNVCFSNLEPLIEGDPTFSTNLVPNLLEKFEADKDYKTFTFYLRKGMRWSDGVPVTTDDVLFTWNDVYLNKELTPVFPRDLTVRGKMPTLEIIDKYSFRIKFPESYGSFLQWVSYHYRNYTWILLPSHYMKKFHVKYTPLTKLAPLIKKEGYGKGEWYKLFNKKQSGLSPWDINADKDAPVLTPWKFEKLLAPNVRSFVRNPYYWKVDEAGNQLPYIDGIRAELFKDSKVILSKVLAGEVDLQPEMVSFKDLPIVKEFAEANGYKIMIFHNWMGTWVQYFPNLTNPDPVWRKIINDVRFRQALSLAIDRKAICDTIFLGFAKPVQVSLLENSKFVEPEFFTAYAEYNPKKAESLLDEMGLKRGPDGWRVRPDGKRLTLPVEFFEVNPYGVPVTEMVVKYWRDIGIDASMKIILSTLWFTKNEANETVMSVWHACAATDKEVILNGSWLTPAVWGTITGWGPLWAKWYLTGGKEGEEPPPKIKELFNYRDTMLYSPDPKEVEKAGKALCRSQAENIWRIGVGDAPVVCIINKDLGNMPEKTPDPDVLTMSVNYDIEQAFWKK